MPFSQLHRRALMLSDELTSEEEIAAEDITQIYYQETELTLEGEMNGGLININCNGQPGSGKSTVMGAEVLRCNKRLKKKTTINHLLANQIVYTQVMRKVTKPQNVTLGIDEYDEVGDTGYNTTVDKAALNHYSDLHRANYIHKIACSPQDLLDKNCYLLLDVKHPKKELKKTLCYLSYIFYRGGIRTTQLLGHVHIDVSEFLDSALYAEYYKRKMERLRMFSHYGLKSEKDIFVAKIILDAYKSLGPIAKYQKIDSNMAELQIDMSTRKLRGMNSWFASNKFARDLLALLKIDETITKMKHTLHKKGKSLSKEALDDYQKVFRQLHEQREENLKYWNNAAKLEPLYMSDFGK